jgi:signal transduction histidine kinase
MALLGWPEMVEQRTRLLPLHQLLAALEVWRSETPEATNKGVHDALSSVVDAYGVGGAYVVVDAPSLPALQIGAGSLAEVGEEWAVERGIVARELELEGSPEGRARIWIDGGGEPADALAAAFELTLDAVSSRHQARLQRQQLEALDGAVRGIAAVQSVDKVLQLIVDRVRVLIGAEYAALGIVGPFDNIEQFVTSGLSDSDRERIGALPRGHGMLGLIIREDSSFLVDDIGTDPRRFGFPPNHPGMHSFLGVPVRSQGRSIGNLYLTNKIAGATFSTADLRLVEMFALHAGIAMENARLHAEVQRLAVVDERQRISQDLHDSIIQSLYGISLSLEDLPEVLADDPAEGAARADRAIDSIHATIRDIRNFIFGLQPELLETSDLATGIRSMAEEFRGNTLIDLEVDVADDLPEMPTEQASHILAITREGLSNISKHSRATRAWVDLHATDGTCQLTIRDNGQGFDPTQPRGSEQHGLANLHARAEALGGQLTISAEPGDGTRLEVEIPMRTEA